MSALPYRTLSDIRDSLTEKCASILLAYRRNCAAATSPSQVGNQPYGVLSVTHVMLLLAHTAGRVQIVTGVYISTAQK